MMKKTFLSLLLAVAALGVHAQDSNDPVIMTIAGQPILRSEFEYSFNKNNSESVIDKKNLNDYLELFVNYKLKVAQAMADGIDTTAAFREEFAGYRDQQILPAMITDDDIEREAKLLYNETKRRVDGTGGMIRTAHILVGVKQNASNTVDAKAKVKADSIYNVLKASNFAEETFAELAKTHSDDRQTSRMGGEMQWMGRGATMPEFDDQIWAMSVGETSQPIHSSAGYHIVQVREKAPYFPYDSIRTNIIRYIDQSGARKQIIQNRVDSLAKAKQITPEEVIAQKREQMVAEDNELKYLIQEYHDGLLLYEEMNANVWEPAANDDAALEKYYKKHKKQYTWSEPRFKGIAYRTREAADVERVKAAIKGVKYDEWNDVLRNTFNSDSVLKIRVEKGVFKQGDNGLIDRDVFGVATAKVREMKDYPNTATYGKILKQPESYPDVKALVVADYQDELEKAWVAELRKRYPVVINKEVVATVNKH